MNYREVLEEFIDLKDKIQVGLGFGIEIEKIDGKLKFAGLSDENFLILYGYGFGSNELPQLFDEYISFGADDILPPEIKEGMYEIEFILSYSEAEYGEYGRVTCPDYWTIEDIIFHFKCDLETARTPVDTDSPF